MIITVQFASPRRNVFFDVGLEPRETADDFAYRIVMTAMRKFDRYGVRTRKAELRCVTLSDGRRAIDGAGREIWKSGEAQCQPMRATST